MDALWLYLEPYTFISEDDEYFLFYNTNNQKGISFHKNESINPIVKKLQNLEELYSIKIDVKKLEDEYIYYFIKNIQNSECGDIMEGDSLKPLIMPPHLNLQRSVERLKLHNLPISEKILTYLHEVAIYINGECPRQCIECKNEFKQHLCCTTSANTLDFDLLKSFLSAISYTGASISILGGDVFKYTELDELIHILRGINSVHTLVTNWLNIPEDPRILSILASESFRLKVTLNNPYETNHIIDLAKRIKQNGINQLWEVSITSISEYEKAEILNQELTDLNIDITIIPFYNGANLDFFEQNVFIGIEDIDALEPDRQNIFARQELNTNDFGKIVIWSDGKVYANINNAPIGEIQNSIEEMLSKELESGVSWRHTRYKAEPCNQCRFKLLCPSPSNYEMIIGKNNLCLIKE